MSIIKENLIGYELIKAEYDVVAVENYATTVSDEALLQKHKVLKELYYFFNTLQLTTKDLCNTVLWSPSIHMPKEAARIFLKVINVRCERLQNISKGDAIFEGCSLYGPFQEYKGSIHPNGGSMKFRAYSNPIRAFQCVWESINSEQSWKENPFVWVYEFEVIDRPENF